MTCPICEMDETNPMRVAQVMKKMHDKRISSRAGSKALGCSEEEVLAHFEQRCFNMALEEVGSMNLTDQGLSGEELDYKAKMTYIINHLMKWAKQLEHAPANLMNAKTYAILAREARGQIKDLKEIARQDRGIDRQQLTQINVMFDDVTTWMANSLCQGQLICPHCNEEVTYHGCREKYIEWQEARLNTIRSGPEIASMSQV